MFMGLSEYSMLAQAQTAAPVLMRGAVKSIPSCHAGPRQYASKLCGLLIDAGAMPLWVPCIEISAVEDPSQVAELHHALQDLSSYTYVAFTSKNGIYAFLHELETLKGDGAQDYIHQSGVKFCALGADSQVLEAAGYEVHVQPQEPSTQGLAREMNALGLLDGAGVLCPVPHVAGACCTPSNATPVCPQPEYHKSS